VPSAQIAAYQAVQTTTADPTRVMLELFEGGARFLSQALRSLERGDLAAYSRLQSRAVAIIAELSSCLDREAGGEVAANLARLYAFMLVHLTEGLIRKSPGHLQRVLEVFQTVRGAFEQAVEQVRAAP
jgi:flagellar protein FliS